MAVISHKQQCHSVSQKIPRTFSLRSLIAERCTFYSRFALAAASADTTADVCDKLR
jgi:hypothetical protein